MKTFQEFKEIVTSLKEEPGHLYLIKKISDVSGLFLLDKQIAFAQSSSSNKSTAVCTNFLEFQPCLDIKSVANDSSFPSGKYDFLILKEKEKEDIIDSFITLTTLYGQNLKMPFQDFIYSVIELFQLPRKQTELDYIGLFGELVFIKKAWEMGLDLSKYWHLNGVYSIYDFSSKKTNIEIKTSPSESSSFLLKHSQVFNGGQNVIVVITLQHAEAMGLSLKELVTYFKECEPFASNVGFQISLQKELVKKIVIGSFEKRFEVSRISGFKANLIPTIGSIPDCISEISYRYHFDISSGMPLSIVAALL
jgi:hypothetical protein